MNRNKFISFPMVLWGAFLFFISIACAEERKFDGISYDDIKISAFFSDLVFSKTVTNESPQGAINTYPYLWSGENRPIFYSSEYFRDNFPWLYPHILPQDGLPNLLTVNKWTKPITVSFGMPKDLESFTQNRDDERQGTYLDLSQSSIAKYKKFRESADFSLVEKNVIESVKQINDLGVLKINYLPREKETTSNFGNVRINLVDFYTPPEQVYKFDTRATYPMYWGASQPRDFREIFEPLIKTGLVFTAGSERQVDGYILRNSLNQIDMAVCFIWLGHEVAMINALVNECIIRSLGFTGTLSSAYKKDIDSLQGYLTPWNETSFDGRKPMPQTGFSAFDLYMVELLYKPQLKAGMNYLDAYKTLFPQQN